MVMRHPAEHWSHAQRRPRPCLSQQGPERGLREHRPAAHQRSHRHSASLSSTDGMRDPPHYRSLARSRPVREQPPPGSQQAVSCPQGHGSRWYAWRPRPGWPAKMHAGPEQPLVCTQCLARVRVPGAAWSRCGCQPGTRFPGRTAARSRTPPDRVRPSLDREWTSRKYHF
eukprot:scaffold32133_cov140-Isochrysis_galbana.AAC.1